MMMLPKGQCHLVAELELERRVKDLIAVRVVLGSLGAANDTLLFDLLDDPALTLGQAIEWERLNKAAFVYLVKIVIFLFSKEEIVRRFIQEENDLTALKKIKSEDKQIAELAAQIKEHEEGIKDRIIALREEIKDIRDEDEEIVELRESRKALEGGYRDEMKRRKAYRDYLYDVMQKAFQA
jgi:septal ring factor EnvC (AmiA/AmiB activator)